MVSIETEIDFTTFPTQSSSSGIGVSCFIFATNWVYRKIIESEARGRELMAIASTSDGFKWILDLDFDQVDR